MTIVKQLHNMLFHEETVECFSIEDLLEQPFFVVLEIKLALNTRQKLVLNTYFHIYDHIL